jgi:hypothetical protein
MILCAIQWCVLVLALLLGAPIPVSMCVAVNQVLPMLLVHGTFFEVNTRT